MRVDPKVEQAVVPAAERHMAATGRLPDALCDGIIFGHDPRPSAVLGHQVKITVAGPGEEAPLPQPAAGPVNVCEAGMIMAPSGQCVPLGVKLDGSPTDLNDVID